MAKRKRTTRPTGIVDRAVSAGRRALREAEKRVPPDLRRQAQRRIKDADKTARAAIKALQTQVNRASTRADVNSVLKRIDGLTKQARQVIGGTGPRRATRAASRPTATGARTRKATRTPTRKATSTRKATPTRKAPPARKASAAPTTTRRASAPRRRRASAEREEEPIVAPMAELDEVEIIDVSEP